MKHASSSPLTTALKQTGTALAFLGLATGMPAQATNTDTIPSEAADADTVVTDTTYKDIKGPIKGNIRITYDDTDNSGDLSASDTVKEISVAGNYSNAFNQPVTPYGGGSHLSQADIYGKAIDEISDDLYPDDPGVQHVVEYVLGQYCDDLAEGHLARQSLDGTPAEEAGKNYQQTIMSDLETELNESVRNAFDYQNDGTVGNDEIDHEPLGIGYKPTDGTYTIVK